jgi:hypothetical protein
MRIRLRGVERHEPGDADRVQRGRERGHDDGGERFDRRSDDDVCVRDDAGGFEGGVERASAADAVSGFDGDGGRGVGPGNGDGRGGAADRDGVRRAGAGDGHRVARRFGGWRVAQTSLWTSG